MVLLRLPGSGAAEDARGLCCSESTCDTPYADAGTPARGRARPGLRWIHSPPRDPRLGNNRPSVRKFCNRGARGRVTLVITAAPHRSTKGRLFAAGIPELSRGPDHPLAQGVSRDWIRTCHGTRGAGNLWI